ncbi:MAG: amidohydrolase family protein, partial [Candidatus Binatia bacterium]
GDPVLGADPAFAGAYVLPGLVDMHVHHPPGMAVLDTQLFALLFLAHGVTAVRDTGSFDGAIFETRRQIRAGAFPGPRVFACGPLLDGDPPIWPQARVLHTKADAESAVAELAGRGGDCVKVYSNLPRDLLAAVREASARAKLPVIGHVPLWVRFEDARLADVQHLTGVPELAPPWTWPHHRLDDWIAAIATRWRYAEESRE